MFNRRLFLIPVWLVAQYAWNAYSQGSFVHGFEAMTSLDSLWVSFVVIVAVVYYAMKAKRPEQAPKAAAPEK